MDRLEKKGNVISFHDVNYDVEIKTSKCGKPTPKKILKNVKGIFKPGMNAIMGPTGSGKSSLLDVLAGRKDPKGLTGTLLIDGKPQPKNYKCICGYVVQDDVVMGTLTVRENIMFSANLRIPTFVSIEEKENQVDQVIGELGLEKCADTKVGNEFIRGVSGGERKRTNIGMELVASQAVLFLDEPTTGLDASTANSVMNLLKKLSIAGRTIVFSIHQPRFSIYRLFDSLMLLSQGQAAYHGHAQEALTYFEGIGYHCDAHNNPADFFLDVILGDVRPSDETEDTNSVEEVENNSNDTKTDIEQGITRQRSKTDISLSLCETYKESQIYQEILDEVDEIYKTYEAQTDHEATIVGQYATSFFQQFKTLSGRGFKNLSRNPFGAILQVIILGIMGIVVGILYFQLGTDYADIQNRQGAFFFISMNMVFSNVNAISVFISERAMFIHENISGFYSVSAFFLSKIVSDLIPLRIVPVTAYAIITYFMAGFQVDVAKFFLYYVGLFLLTMAAASICFFTSCLSGIFAVANLLTIIILILMLVFGGLFINLKTLGDWLSWLQYLSIFRYALKIFYINEMKDMVFSRTITINGTEIVQNFTGNAYLDEQDIRYETGWDFGQNHLALIIITGFFLILSYIRLRTMKKLK